MAQTRKFSQFAGPSPIQAGDIVVGLRTVNGRPVNYQFTGVGGGGGGGTGVTTTITQVDPLFLGQWVRVNSSGVYVPAQADTPQDAEVIGIVVAIPDVNMYTIQQSGYLSNSAVISELVDGDVYFLDTVNPGQMVAVDATINGQVSRPVFVADTPTSGWVVPYRGLIVGQGLPNGGGGTTPVDSNIVTVVSNGHGFMVGNWIRVTTPSGGQPKYVLALADSLADAQSVGVVIQVIDANTFRVQFSGYVAGNGPPTTAPFQDQTAAALVPASVYYLSATSMGNISTINPSAMGVFSKPLYISEQSIATTGLNAGYILPQRPLDISESGGNNPVIHTVTQNNSFDMNGGQWLYIDPVTSLYQLAQADTLARAQVAGVTLSATATNFVIQQSGWVSNIVIGNHSDIPLTTGTVFYLSLTTEGNISSVVPGVGQVSKPCYVQENSVGFIGEILPQRPLVVINPAPPPPGGGNLVLIETYNLATNPTGVSVPNIFGAYTDITIIFRNVVMVNTGVVPNQYYGSTLTLGLATGGAFDMTTNDYNPDGHVVVSQYGFPMMVNNSALSGQGNLSTQNTNGATINLPGGLTSNWQVYIQGVSNNGDYKVITIENQGYSTTALYQRPLYTYTIGQFGGTTGNFAPLTGFNTQWGNTGLNQFRFVSGTVSVYGTAS